MRIWRLKTQHKTKNGRGETKMPPANYGNIYVITINENTSWSDFVSYLQTEYANVPLDTGENNSKEFFSNLAEVVPFTEIQIPVYGIYANWRNVAVEILNQLIP